MALTAYLNQTRRLLQNPAAPIALYSDADLTSWINIARGQLAGESESIRYMGSISTVALTNVYNFSGISTGTPSANGIQGVINVSQIWYVVASGQKWVTPRAWPWFSLYVLNNPVPQGSYPTDWSQYGQGTAPGSTGSVSGGSFYINVPDIVYTLALDCVCYPIALVDDTTKEAIPYLWTDAIPYYAAYLALLSAQNNARLDDAKQYFNMYTEFVERARRASNPSINRWMYSQAGDPVQANKIALQKQQGAA